MMKLFVVAAALAVLCHSLPVENSLQPETIRDEFQTQALIAMGKSTNQGKFKNFIPSISQIVVYTSAILPTVRAKKEQKKLADITEHMLLQTVVEASGQTGISDLEKYLPTGDDVLIAMEALGTVMGGSSGYNPIQMMTNLVGKDDMVKIIEECMHFPLRFPEPTEDQIFAAEQCVLSIGLGFVPQEEAIDKFTAILTKEQKDMIDSLEKNVIERIMNVMTTLDGEPTPALISEIKRQMSVMEKKTGSTDMMPEEFKELVAHSVNSTDEGVHAQALLAIGANKKSVGTFKDLMPLVGQSFLYAGVLLPSVKMSKQHRHNAEITSSMLIQTINESVGAPAISDLEKYLPTADDMLTAMIAVGNVVGGSSGFNPIELLSNVVGRDDLVAAIDEMTKFPMRFPDFTDSELAAAEEVLISVGLGFVNQETAIQQFRNALSEDKLKMIDSLEKNVVKKLMFSLVTESGEPTQKLVEEIKRQMSVMEKKTGSTEMMPAQLKDLVVDNERAQTEALIAIQATTTKKQFKDFIPLLSQVVVCTGAVLPSVRAHKAHTDNKSIATSSLIQSALSEIKPNPIESVLPTASDMLDAMIAVGNVMGGSSGYNPVKMMSNIVGKDSMVEVLDEVMKFPLRFPDLKDSQISAAEDVLLSVGLGFISQEDAIDRFYDVLDADQKNMITSLQKNVVERVMNAMTTPEGEPTPALIEEIKAEMRQMEKTKGSTEMMPQELKDLVKA